jgi:hypothetical protein
VCKECGGFSVLAKTLYKHAKYRAAKDKIPFLISEDEILELIGSGVCPVLGIVYDLGSRTTSDKCASLEKFHPEKGYVDGNCFVISYRANRLKSDATLDELRKVVSWVEEQENKIRTNEGVL